MLFATIDEDERVAPAATPAPVPARERAAYDQLDRGVNRMIFSVCALVALVLCASYASGIG